MEIRKSIKLQKVGRDIRGPVLHEAAQMEAQGHTLIHLNIGNPAAFGFEAPAEILQDVMANLAQAVGYCDSKGLFSARKAIVQYYQQKCVFGVDVGDVYIGNGISEMILMAMQALLNNGDEILIPCPDYPLWTAAVTLAGGNPIHYRCDETADWMPDMADIEANISQRTKGIVIVNPNNPTGAVYPKLVLEQLVEIARRHDLIIFADEIYDQVIYDEATHIPIASLVSDILCVTFNGLSKNYRSAGFRTGWLMLSGAKLSATSYVEGLDMLASMRLCANVPAQYAIQTALGGHQSIHDLTRDTGRLLTQRNLAWELLTAIPGVSCVKPKGGFYLFPKLDPHLYPIQDDEQFVLELLRAEKLLLVQGTAFNWPYSDHLRWVFLLRSDELIDAIARFSRFLAAYRRHHAADRRYLA
ncbi:MAG: pyridoxal phosphate-dependent aminotransferase [Agitococcus sp.]|nr:pyridoxal phosphate-dependent aminotransferase [Agitococcus sp.]